MTNGQTSELIALFAKQVALDMPEDVAQGWIENPKGFGKVIREALMPEAEKNNLPNIGVQIADWKDFYQKFFGIVLDMDGVRIPDYVAGFDRLIVVAKDVSINQIYEKGKKHFSSWKWCGEDISIESVMQESEHGEVKETYAIWVRDDQEADKDLLGKSALDVERPEDTESLLERLLHGFKYWSETGEHLDVKTYTLCASSRYSDGDVPYVSRFDDGRVHVSGCYPQRRDGYIGARRVVR
ncbi:MAG: hypothetical protein Q8L64_05915 [bacterium]|nr:hypothetical protein [bacterium]